MATGSFGGQLQSAISSRLTADPYEKRRQAAMGSYQDQAEKSRKDLSERLNRLGVLRGGGATASQFGEFESGVLRGQQALDAQFEAQREAGVGQAIQQGLGLYGTDQQFGLAGRQQTEAERMGQFSRDLGTREFLSQDALRRDQQRESERAALAQEGMQRGALTGIYDGQRTLDQQRQDLAYRTGLAQTFGTDLGGDDTTRQTEARRAQGVQEGFQRAGITGQFDGQDTLQRSLAEAELTGRYGAEDTLAAQTLDLQEGQALGTIGGQDTLARDALQQEATQASMERGLRRTEGMADRNLTRGQAGLDRQAAADLQAARITGTSELQQDQFDEAALEREARERESGRQRDLAREELYGGYTTEYDRQMGRVGTLAKTEGAAERQARADLQQAQFGQETSQAALQRGLAREELYGGVTTDYERAMGAKTLAASGQAADIAAENRRLAEMETAGASQREIALAQQAEIERSALIREGFEGRRVGVAEQTRRDQVAQERQRMALAEQELYGGAEEITLDNLELDPALEMGAGRNAAVRQALQQRLGREPSQDEVAAITGGNSIRGRQTLAAQEAREGRTFAAGQAALDRGLTRSESELARGLSREDLALRGELGRGQLAQDTRRTDLASAELYGTGDPRRQTGETAAARESRLGRGLEERRLAEVERAGADMSRLQEAELYGRQLSDYERAMGGTATASSRQAAQDLALRRQLGEGQLEQDTRRTDLARDELRGYSELYPGGMREDTAAVREGKAARGLESRRLDEAERSALVAEQADRDRLGLAEEELYGGVGRRGLAGTTLASREAGLDREQRVLDRALDQERLDLAEEELYGGVGRRGLAGTTLASREAAADRESREDIADADRRVTREGLYGTGDETKFTGDTLASRAAAREQADRATALGYEGRRVREQEQAGRSARNINNREQRYRQEQRNIDNALLALGVIQTGSGIDGYEVSDEERALVRSMLGGYRQSGRGDYYNAPPSEIVVEDPVVEDPESQFRDPEDPAVGRFANGYTAPSAPKPTSRRGQYGLTYTPG